MTGARPGCRRVSPAHPLPPTAVTPVIICQQARGWHCPRHPIVTRDNDAPGRRASAAVGQPEGRRMTAAQGQAITAATQQPGRRAAPPPRAPGYRPRRGSPVHAGGATPAAGARPARPGARRARAAPLPPDTGPRRRDRLAAARRRATTGSLAAVRPPPWGDITPAAAFWPAAALGPTRGAPRVIRAGTRAPS